MSKKLFYLIFFVLMFVVAGNASAATILWDGGGDANNWNEPNNWNTDSLPLIEDDVRIDVNDANCVIDSNAVCRVLYLSYTANRGPCYVHMNGGVFTMGSAEGLGQLTLGRSANGTGVFTLDDGTIDINDRLGVGMSGNGTFTMNGGEVTVYDKVEVGRNAGGNGVMYIYDGNATFTGDSTDFEIAGSGTGTVYMEGGYVYVQDNIKLAQGATGIGRLYLNGGTLSANTLRDPAQVLGDPLIDITEGTLILRGSAGPTLAEQYIDNGWLVAYGGDGRVEIDTSSGDAVMTGVELDPNCAKYIRPGRGVTLNWTTTGPTLEWSQGDYAASHDVYLGTDFDDVNDANNSSPEFKGNKPYATTTYNQGPLSLGTTYYWRIDEVNALHPDQLWKGEEVWKFTMQDYVIVDDMDEYGDDGTKPWIPGGRICYVWRDVQYISLLGDLSASNKTGAQTGYYYGTGYDYSETDIVRSGSSMPFYYENDGDVYSKPVHDYYYPGLKYYSEACARTTGDNSLPDIDTDWTVGGVEALSLWFYGDPNNDPNVLKMYVALGDSDSNGVVYYTGDINDIKKAEWQEWNIPLSSFTGVTLADVRRIYIGLGQRGNVTTKSGKGRMFFDDIRLYPARCVYSLLQPEADLDNDCDVDYDDLAVMTGDWLESDYTGIGSDGVLTNFPNDNSQWVVDPCRGKCLSFDGIDDWVDLEDSEFGDFHNRTIALWVNIRSFSTTENPYIFCFRDDDDLPGPYRVYIREHGDPNVRIQFIGDTASDYSKDFNEVDTNTWHHLAFVLRDTGSDTCTGEFYGDGEKIHEFIGRRRHSGPARSVCIGTWNEGGTACIDALVDDFRVYFDALSANNIKYLAGKPGGVAPTANMLVYYKFDETTGQIAANSSTYQFNRPLTSVAELYTGEPVGSRKVNFKDYAILVADDWLKEAMLWP